MEKEKLIALVTKSQAGDMDAMEQLLVYAHTPVSFQCRKMLKNEQDAEDMTQEILIALYEKLNTLQEPAAFNKWVQRIAATRCINALNRTHVEYQIAEDEEGNSILDNLEDMDEMKIPDKALDNSETTRMIGEIVDSLPEAQKICTYLFYYDELSVKEIASMLTVPENTVKSRLNYARNAIKAKVKDYEKQGIKLYSLSPLPFLWYFLHRAKDDSQNKKAAGIMVRKILQDSAVGAAAVAGTGTAVAAAKKAGLFSGVSRKAGALGAAWKGSLAAKVLTGLLAVALGIGTASALIPNRTAPETVPAATEAAELSAHKQAPSAEEPETEEALPEETEEVTEAAEETEAAVPETTVPAPVPQKPNSTPKPTEPPAAPTEPTEAPITEIPQHFEGDFIEAGSFVDPTCTTDGYNRYVCSCGAETVVPVPATGHQYEETGTTAQGLVMTCRVCGDSYVQPSSNGCQHTFLRTTLASTCTAQGWTRNECSKCGYVQSGSTTALPINSSAHAWNPWLDQGPTVVNPDMTPIRSRMCRLCGAAEVQTIRQPETSHAHTYVSTVLSTPTCTTTGTTLVRCTSCGYNFTTTQRDGHKYVDNYTGTGTCTDPKQHIGTCSECGHVQIFDIVAQEHDYQVTVIEPTDSSEGITYERCSYCNDYRELSRKPPLTGECSHTYVVSHSESVYGNCQSDGIEVMVCSKCGDKIQKVSSSPDTHKVILDTSTAHSPTCTESGSKGSYVCTLCGKVTGEESLYPYGHSYSSQTVAPTETTPGFTVHTCKYCGDSYVDNFKEPTGSSSRAGFAAFSSDSKKDNTAALSSDQDTGTAPISDEAAMKSFPMGEAG